MEKGSFLAEGNEKVRGTSYMMPPGGGGPHSHIVPATVGRLGPKSGPSQTEPRTARGDDALIGQDVLSDLAPIPPSVNRQDSEGIPQNLSLRRFWTS